MKTVLLGMNNPLSDDPTYALFPLPVGCTGYRVCEMLQEAAARAGLEVSRNQYIKGFDRMNVLNGRHWSKSAAKDGAAGLKPVLDGRRTVIFGVETIKALGVPRPPDWFDWRTTGGDLLGESAAITYALLPHPSGRCREYNDPAVRARAGDLLLGEWLRGQPDASVE